MCARPPTGSREALFSILGPLDGLAVLDLFAGTGALGIEALSRGAQSCVFVDVDTRPVEANLEALGIDAQVRRGRALSALRPGIITISSSSIRHTATPRGWARSSRRRCRRCSTRPRG